MVAGIVGLDGSGRHWTFLDEMRALQRAPGLYLRQLRSRSVCGSLCRLVLALSQNALNNAAL